MVRQLQDDEPMQTVTVRMPAWMVADIDAYRARLKAQNRAFRIERGEAVRDLLLKALALVEENGPVGPGAAGTGPVLAGSDQVPMGEDRNGKQAAQDEDHGRTTGRTGRKRTGAKG
jgi:hypothetical protein